MKCHAQVRGCFIFQEMLEGEELTGRDLSGRGGLLCGQSRAALPSWDSQAGRGDRPETNETLTRVMHKCYDGKQSRVRGWRITGAVLDDVLWEGLSEEMTCAGMRHVDL